MFGDVRYKRAIDTNMRAGREGDRLWFAAVWPLDDLFGRPGDQYTPFGANKALKTGLDHILFVEVYTDEQDRPYSGNCCVVDIWSTSPPGTAFATDWAHGGEGVNFAKVSWKMEAAWGGYNDEKETRTKWLNVPVDTIVREDSVLHLFRYTVDEEGFQFAKEERLSWARHAVRWLRRGVEKLLVGVGRGPMGTLAYEGEYSAREVVNYFIHIGEG